MSAQPHGVSLRLLGDPAIHLPDGSVRALERRAAGLLALVALEPSVTRARAAALLWSQSDDSRKALRQQLLRFRKLFGVMLVSGDEALRLADGVATDLDSGSEPLLGALGFEDCEEFADWLARQRAARRGVQIEPLLQKLVQAESERDFERGLGLAEQLLTIEPDSEAHQRSVIRLHYLRGDLAQAQASYERLKRRLRTRFGTAPSAETEALARLLRSAQAAGRELAPAAATTPVTQTPASLLRPPRLVGRARELAALRAAWQAPRAVLVLGEPGLGKSRLLAEFAQGQRVLTVQARPGDAGVPYALLARLLRLVMERCMVQIAESGRGELARLLPELAPGVPFPTAGQRLLLQHAIESTLGRARLDDAPLEGVIVDDLHFADEASVEMLQSLVGSTDLIGLRWALARRPGEGGAAIAALSSALQEAGILTALQLAPLDERALAELICSLGIAELDPSSLAGALARHTGGNPLFALETLKLGLAGGQLRHGRLPQPDSVGALIELRLGQLSPRALALARLAAIAGVDFGIALAERVTGERVLALTDAWRELQSAQVLRDTAFAHDLVGDAVLRQLPEAIARHLHREVAAWLAEQEGEPARVALHWSRAGRSDLAGPRYLAAAQRAQAALRVHETAALAEQALGCSGWLDPAGRWTAALLRVDALQDIDFGDRIDAALNALDQAATCMREHATAQVMRGTVEFFRGRYPEALALAERSVTSAHAAQADGELIQARALQARALSRLGSTDEAMALLRSETDRAEKVGGNVAFELHGLSGNLLQAAARIPEARQAYERALPMAQPLGRLRDLTSLLNNLAICDHLAGQCESALLRIDQSLRLSQQLELAAVGRQFLRMNRAVVLLDLGRYGDALAEMDLAERDVGLHAPSFLPLIGALRARWYAELGQPHRAEREIERLPTDAQTAVYVVATRRTVQAQVMAARGRDGAAVMCEALLQAANCGRNYVHWEARLAAAALGLYELAGDLDALALDMRARGLRGHEAAALAFSAACHVDAKRAHRALALLAEPVCTRWLSRGDVMRACVVATAGTPQGAAVAAEARRWLLDTAERHVPAEFRDSFLYRRAAHRQLLAGRA